MTSELDLVLTDDEVAAAVVEANAAWPGVLPTVDCLDANDLLAAVLRGQRSLLVRDIEGDQLARVQAAAAAPIRAMAYFCDQKWEFMQGSVTYSIFEGTDEQGWLQDTGTPLGVHYIGYRHRSEVFANLRSLVASARQQLAEMNDDILFAVVRPSDPGYVAIRLSGRGVSQVQLQRDGMTETSSTDIPVDEIDHALEDLFERVRIADGS